jgi:ferredoxin-NADP reductase
MRTFETRFLRRAEVADGTMAFYFARPFEFDFRAGQAVTLTLIDPPETDAKGNRRTFSIASAPREEVIMIASRMRDTAFKRTLKTMPRSTLVQLRGPIGKFILDPVDERPAVMLAGGIGITPFFSMLRQSAEESQRRRLYLFYSNRTPQSAPFLEELGSLERRNPCLRVIATMTGLAPTARNWGGPRGFINEEMLARNLDDLLEPIYYVAGPPQMVAAMLALLTAAGVPKEHIHTDEFFGY